MLLKLNTSFRPSWRKLARAGIQDSRNCLDARFRGHDDKGALNFQVSSGGAENWTMR